MPSVCCESVVPIPSAVQHSTQARKRSSLSSGTVKTTYSTQQPSTRPSGQPLSSSARPSSSAQPPSAQPSVAAVTATARRHVETPVSAARFPLPGHAPAKVHQFVPITPSPTTTRTASSSSVSQVNGHVPPQPPKPRIAPLPSGISIAANEFALAHPLAPTPPGSISGFNAIKIPSQPGSTRAFLLDPLFQQAPHRRAELRATS